jgi:preprotein translocase subunit SecA
VADEIADRNHMSQPVLVGTISVEVSELLGRLLTERGIKHHVLNAKPEHAEREGETIAEAGRPGAVTIATNMAGRGVDIKLGGNAEHMTYQELTKLGLSPEDGEEYDRMWDDVLPKVEQQVLRGREQVTEAGGLFILGTERHESRRIDNQLRGRSGRQGDPGESRFYLSAEDDLVRLFAGDRIYKILDRLGPLDAEGEEQPLENKLLTRQIEGAQKKVEEQNFLIRKRVLEYDDVMNQQREVVYEYRDRILEGEDISDTARLQIGQAIERMGDEYLVGDFVEEWDLDGLFTQLEQLYPVAIGTEDLDPNALERSALVADLREDVIKAYNEREEELGSELMRALERFVLLQIIDDRWREHLHDMDYLREGIHLRGFAQIDPLVAYKNEGFEMFTTLMNAIWEEFARYIFHVDVQVEGEDPAAAVPAPNGGSRPGARALEYSGGGAEDQPSALAAARAQAVTAGAGGVASAYPDMDSDLGEPVLPGAEGEVVRTMEPRRLDEHEQIGRNDPCWCGSGQKFKKCHGA